MESAMAQWDEIGGTRWLSLAWGAWALESDQQNRFERVPGLRPMDGLSLLDQALRSDAPQKLVLCTRAAEGANPPKPSAQSHDRPQPAAESQTHPTDPVLRHVLQGFEEILGHSSIDPDADFFALGGESLAALRLAIRLKDHGYDCLLYTSPSPRDA